MQVNNKCLTEIFQVLTHMLHDIRYLFFENAYYPKM